MPNSYSRRNRSNNSTFALLSKPPLAPAPQVEGRLVTPGGVGQHSPAQGGHHSIAKPPRAPPQPRSRLAEPGVVGHPLSRAQAQKLPLRQAVGAAPFQAALAVEPFE